MTRLPFPNGTPQTLLALVAVTLAVAIGLTAAFACTTEGSGPDDTELPNGTGVKLVPVATGLSFPLYLTAPAGDPRLFIIEKTGDIRIVKNGALLDTPFLSLAGQVSGGSEQGLLGLAFHPSYATNGIFVVSYTNTDGDTRIASYHVSDDPDVANATSATPLLEADQPAPNHNGGDITFGPDGFLYIGLGDGGGSGDTYHNGQDLTDVLGSLLRLAVDDEGVGSVPPDNPFVDVAADRPEIWNYGLRNPWRFSFDRQTGDLYIADVGQGAREEVNVVTAGSGGGQNFGWPITEGTTCYNAATCDKTDLTMPVLEYNHDHGCSITGGYVYRGAALVALQGTYFYADYCNAWVHSFKYAGGQATEEMNWPALAVEGSIPSFGEDASGELYVLNGSVGTVFKIVAE